MKLCAYIFPAARIVLVLFSWCPQPTVLMIVCVYVKVRVELAATYMTKVFVKGKLSFLLCKYVKVLTTQTSHTNVSKVGALTFTNPTMGALRDIALIACTLKII